MLVGPMLTILNKFHKNNSLSVILKNTNKDMHPNKIKVLMNNIEVSRLNSRNNQNRFLISNIKTLGREMLRIRSRTNQVVAQTNQLQPLDRLEMSNLFQINMVETQI